VCAWINSVPRADLQYCFDVENCWRLSRELAAAADEFAAGLRKQGG
jgi:hypothetical protein